MVIISLIGVLSFIVFLFATKLGICSINSSCIFTTDPIAETLLIFIPVFILSLITHKLKNETFQAWLKFSYVWIPLTIILTLLVPEYSNSLVPVEKAGVSFLMSALFLLISLIIIIKKSFFSKK